jgi:hypothetical protein
MPQLIRSMLVSSHTVLVAFCWITSFVFLVVPTMAAGERTVRGTITDRNNTPAGNVRVKAFDQDPLDADDYMGFAMTDSNGRYSIGYAGGHWDPSPSHAWTIWRPDIYIRVSAPVNGWCTDKQWNDDKRWIHLKDSGVTSDHPHRSDLTKNLRVEGLPLPSIASGTFTLGVNMWCRVDFFFHHNCFACTAANEKIQWDDWGITGVPRTASRCDVRPLPNCTDADWGAIRDLDRELREMDLPTDKGRLP